MNETLNALLGETSVIMHSLHFIRADWFYAFIPLLLYFLLCYKRTLDNRNWLSVVDTQLMPFVLSNTHGKQRRYPLLLTFIAASLCITALAGPVYKKLPQPVYREQSSLVVLFDLSQSMNATDIKPSRLSRSKLKLLDLLKTRKTGQTALIVYAADAFVVTPLTDDNITIANLVPSLETDMMPAQGSNLSNALGKTVSLLTQAGVVKGDILVITDGIHQRDESAIKKVVSQGYRLSILGIGTKDGGPIPLAESLGGGFLQDSDGAIVIAKLQADKLQAYALSGSGLYSSLSADDSDINKLSRLIQSSEIAQHSEQDNNTNDLNADLWQEEGHWLLLPLLFFAALWARKGWLAAALPFALLFILPLAQPAHADTVSEPINTANFDSKHLWSSPDQKAMKAFNAGDNENAAKQFTQKEWKASAHYRNGNFEAAAEILKDTQSSDGFYNKGNALAKLGKYQEAIKAYEKAIGLDGNNDDAIYNLEQVKNTLQQQKNQAQENQQKNDQQQDQQQSDEQSEQQPSDQDSEQQGDQQQNDQQQNDQKNDNPSEEQSSQQDKDKQQPDKNQQSSSETKQQQQAEEENLKQRDAEAEKKKQEEEQQQYEQQQKQQNKDDKNSDDENRDSENNEIQNKEGEEKPAEIEVNPMEASISEDEKATEQWLKRIPDDPGGLLRRKFYYQYQQVPNQNDDEQPW